MTVDMFSRAAEFAAVTIFFLYPSRKVDFVFSVLFFLFLNRRSHFGFHPQEYRVAGEL